MKGIFLLFTISTIFCGLEATLKTYYVEELCYVSSVPIVRLDQEKSGILTSISSDTVESCKITLMPGRYGSVVLSIYKYQLQEGDELIIEDSDNHKVSLIGRGIFPDEKKSILSDGRITIYYKKNSTADPYNYLKFQFTFTLTSKGPCSSGDFECRNRRCVPKKLVCDGHNHCGDGSGQENCSPTTDQRQEENESEPKVTVKYPTGALPIIVISVLGVTLLAFAIAFFIICLRGIKRNKEASQTDLPSVEAAAASTNSASPSETQTGPSVFAQIRRSFRYAKNQKLEETKLQSENYQVPSMYPHFPDPSLIPSAQNQSFPEMKSEEKQSERCQMSSVYPLIPSTIKQNSEEQKLGQQEFDSSKVHPVYPEIHSAKSQMSEQQQPEAEQSKSSHVSSMYPEIQSAKNQTSDEPKPEAEHSDSSQIPSMYPEIQSDKNQTSEEPKPEEPESFQMPFMYPQIQSVLDSNYAENPAFKTEE